MCLDYHARPDLLNLKSSSKLCKSLITKVLLYDLQAETLLGYLREQRQGGGSGAGPLAATSLAR